MSKETRKPGVYPTDEARGLGKFIAVLHDGSADPYAYRTEKEAQAAVDASKPAPPAKPEKA